jgi:hypothetical protein
MENSIISIFKNELTFWKKIIIHFDNVEADRRLLTVYTFG